MPRYGAAFSKHPPWGLNQQPQVSLLRALPAMLGARWESTLHLVDIDTICATVELDRRANLKAPREANKECTEQLHIRSESPNSGVVMWLVFQHVTWKARVQFPNAELLLFTALWCCANDPTTH